MDRKILEAQFHDQRELDRSKLSDKEFLKKYPNKGFYVITGSLESYIDKSLSKICEGKVVLDYCCGLGKFSRHVTKFKPACVYGIDISEKEIETAKGLSLQQGLEINYKVMDAENMDFGNDKFDVVMCKGVLHHLDVNKAYREIFRVLKPGGVVIVHEALGYNPLIQLYRKLTPKIRTEWETDHILTMKEVKLAKNLFQVSDIKFFYLCSILAIPFRNSKYFNPILRTLEMLDAIILKMPFVKYMGWQMVFEMKKARNIL